MAKDVDLSSKRWLDLIFEGKNKDFGAYELRSKSAKRHNLAVIVSISLIALATLGGWGWIEYNEYQKQKLLEEEKARQEALERERARQEELAEEEEIEVVYDEPEEEKVPEEEVQDSQKKTEFNVVADELAQDPIRTNDEELKDDRAVNTQDVDTGNKDITADVLKTNQEIGHPEETKPDKPAPPPPPPPAPKPQKEEVFTSAAHMPEFPGGNAALQSYLSKNLRYPQVAQDNGIQGKVVVQFVVEKDGSIGEIKVVRAVDKDLDKEAVRVCKHLPKFTPGKNAVGDPVRVWFTLPVQFKLQNPN